jgi:transcriptional regulator with PAS, ATPase and Fis domain
MPFEPILRAEVMKRINAKLRLIADKDVVVTLTGESGTGKEVLARRLHELSRRRAGPFVPINCAAIPEPLFESEFFGHERGAFTGATERARGRVEAAVGGTLFLDEIGELPLPMQAKFLRFLENKRFMRVGGTEKLEADVRLVCATHRPLEEEVAAGRFRKDLYYRIQGITVPVPALRERRADIPALISQLLSQLSAKHGTPLPRFPRQVQTAMLAYSWPGNVRELKNVLEALCLLRAGKLVRMADLPTSLQTEIEDRRGETLQVDLTQTLAQLEERVIEAVLLAEGGNTARAAARLGISIRTIQRRRSLRDTRS